MNKKIIYLVIKILAGLLIVVCIGLGVYSYIKANNQVIEDEKNSIISYLSETYKDEVYNASPLLGLLNFNFDNTSSTISIEKLVTSKLMSNSKMNDEGIDSIYRSKFGVTKSEYENKSNYMANPNGNCYYYQNVLKKSGYNCSSICSLNDTKITQEIINKLKWDNVTLEDTKNYCIKNAVYPIEDNGYFVNVSDLKTLYKNITNTDLSLNSDITSSNYYAYGAYLVTVSNRLEDYIKEITSINELSIKNNTYIADYTAITLAEKEIKGTVTLEKENDKYYIVANKIETKYNLFN